MHSLMSLACGIAVLCHIAGSRPVLYQPAVLLGRHHRPLDVNSVAAFVDDYREIRSEPVHFVVRREAPSKDLKASATGYGYGGGYGHGGGGGGGGGGYGHGGYPTGYVSYGAKTGGYGAFSWYTDHPVGGGYGYH